MLNCTMKRTVLSLTLLFLVAFCGSDAIAQRTGGILKNGVLRQRQSNLFQQRARNVQPKVNVAKPFNGNNLDNWTGVKSDWPNVWKIGTATVESADSRDIVIGEVGKKDVPCMINAVPGDWRKEPRQGVDIFTNEKFGDCSVSIELLLPKGSNSGVYLMGEYEVQVSDSFGKPAERLGQGDMGAIYSAAKPAQNACNEPGTWQKYEIEFVAPTFDADGKKTANAVFKKITLNGKVVQENVEVKGPTGGGITMKEAATGPLMLQGNHGPVAYRNIKIVPASN